VLGLLESELSEIHLVFEPALGGHCLHERLNLVGDRLLARLEESGKPHRTVTLHFAEGSPVLGILREIELGRIPEQPVALLEEPHRNAVPAEPALADGFEPLVRLMTVLTHGSS
jgi:hypothetical protein